MDENLRSTARQFETGKHRRVLTTRRIVFLVVAAAAPLAAMIATLPIAVARGNGAGVPVAFFLATLTLICFVAGYAAISRRIVSTGAFFTYVARGLGKPAGVGAAFVALIAYLGVTVGLAAFLGYFLNLVLTPSGVHLPWYAYATIGMAIVGLLGYRSIDLSSKILGALMTIEILVLAVFDANVLVARGAGALPLASFAPRIVFTPGLAVALMFAFTAFIGFESAALYGEESRSPKKSIPRATYISVFLIGGFYMLTAWITVGAMGRGDVSAMAEKAGSLLMFDLMTRYGGPAMSDITALLVCTSLLASYLALHNAAARYTFALAREKLLFKPLGEFHPARYAPSRASLAVSGVTLACVLSFAASGLDPYQAGIPLLIGIGTLGIIVLQAFAGIAIVAYLATRRGAASRGVILASAVGAIGLCVASVLVSIYFPLLATVDLPFVAWLPLVYPVAIAAGVTFGLWLRRHRPRTYADLASVALRANAARRVPAQAHFRGRYCIVGAGPCGLVAARAFRRAGIPYDQFERHSDVGGIWDIDNPGSSMYESAHFISSRYTSNFFGFPMPASYPDYPDHRQILAYIRDFADAFDLRSGVRFGTGVEQARPLGEDARDGWEVTLSTGEIRHYQGLVCANGVNWHPNLPEYPGLEGFRGEAMHTVDYRSPDRLRGKRVLIVGAGNSGVDIACDAARHADTAMISVRRGYRFVPKHIFGVPTDVFLLGQVHPPKGVVVPDDPSRMLDAIVGDLTRYGLPAPDHKALESHPIMNTQILHYLAHGDLAARPDIERFTPDGVVFTDGRHEAFDLVLFATGYRWKVPYLDPGLFDWKPGGHPDLYLNIFHRTLRGLSVVGFIELASAGYQRYDEMAQMAAMDAWLLASGYGLEAWTRMKAGHHPNLKGGRHYVDSPRHENYVDVEVFRRILSEIRETFSWPDPDDAFYAHMRVPDDRETTPGVDAAGVAARGT